MSPQRGRGRLSPARKQRRGRGWPQGEVISPAPGGLPGAQAPQGLDAVPPRQALSVVPPSPWSPALQGASIPQRGWNMTGTSALLLLMEKLRLGKFVAP